MPDKLIFTANHALAYEVIGYQLIMQF